MCVCLFYFLTELLAASPLGQQGFSRHGQGGEKVRTNQWSWMLCQLCDAVPHDLPSSDCGTPAISVYNSYLCLVPTPALSQSQTVCPALLHSYLTLHPDLTKLFVFWLQSGFWLWFNLIPFFEITLHKSNGWLDSSLSVLPFSSTLGLSWATTYILVISSNISKYAPHPWRKEKDYLCFIFSPPKNLCLIVRSLIQYMIR